MKNKLLEEASIFLLKKDFTVKTLTRSCFDIFARNKEQILLIKVLEDANSIIKEYTDEMNKVANYVAASPLIIAEKAGDELEDNVVYARCGFYTLNLKTFQNCVENHFPFIKRTQAGLTASLAGSKLREKREEQGYSLNNLSKKIGVSSRMIVRYENENSEITVNKAMKLYDLFGSSVFNKVDVFSYNEEIIDSSKSDFSKKYSELGFKASDMRKVPFNIIAKKEKEIILTEVGDKQNPQAKSLSRLLGADNLVIFKKKKPKDIPAVTKKEFMEFEKSRELIKFLREY